MIVKKIAGAFAAAALVVSGPVAAQSSAQSLSLANTAIVDRAGAEGDEASELRRRGLILPAIAAAAIILAILALTDTWPFDNGPDSP